ncbi:rhamnan synthesis F family protein [Neoaquamicrobium sediminum]|uniref:rhamnan synthesis F family protein n=1 Tax=Neoaquamicrobium sediminum TaxID=1849104 RepID=UPI001564FC24|nr:rhamnan synthesis F family protein [Mesorhizobium sediminum]NRC56199.1 polysaccharide biosynthesis-like protein [Mesorhizobium sediminum]
MDPLIEAIGRRRSEQPRILRVFPGARDHGPKQAVFVHHDPKGIVHDYVRFAVQELASNGYAVTFVSNAPVLNAPSVAKLLPDVREVVHRRGLGYDFGAWQEGIMRLPALEQLDRLILVNDSVYGPIFPLSNALKRAEEMRVDVFGITDSREFAHHLQSYFLLFFPRALQSKAFRSFWAGFPMVNSKSWVVRNGEVKLSTELERAGLRLGTLCPYASLLESAGRDPQSVDEATSRFLASRNRKILAGKPLNPMHYFWEELVRDHGCPFLKRDLVRSNPARLPHVFRWSEVLHDNSSYDVNLVSHHLASSSNRKA